MRVAAGLALLALALLAGCAQAPSRTAVLPGPGFVPLVQVEGRQWWRTCFSMPFDDNGRPRWSMDLLLADRVAGPAIMRHAGSVPLWRFHRRAAPDDAGHRFSLLFFTDQQTAAQIDAEIAAETLLPALIARGYLSRVDPDCRVSQPADELAATSDREWDVRLQRTWPYFIMGVSANWLALIEDVGAAMPEQADEPDRLLARYADIGAQIDAIWAANGRHAYLHHLQALFGYEPLPIEMYLRF